jgi:UDP-N-acetylglucosamine:LPS N-acetylglucosamine transferase
MKDLSREIFGNKISSAACRKADKNKRSLVKKFGDDSGADYRLGLVQNNVIGQSLGVKNIVIGAGEAIDPSRALIIGNIRMGFGHYRIAMAIASAAQARGFIPCWMDFASFEDATGSKIIRHLNSLYSLGSRLSQKYKLFNKFYWEPLNSEGFRRLTYNAADQKMTELMAPLCRSLDKTIPFAGTHTWATQAAVHAGLSNTANVICDNWPMALHLAEGSMHFVQTPSAYTGYRLLNGMLDTSTANPIPASDIRFAGHYIDHEFVVNLESDTALRFDRIRNKKAKRILLTVGGAGAQGELYKRIIAEAARYVKENKAVLLINTGDHDGVCTMIREHLKSLALETREFADDWSGTERFCADSISADMKGVYLFKHSDIFAAVYCTNLLMRLSDIMITKPSELAYYPVPKIMVKRIGGHEAWGAIRSAEVGDGTIEIPDTDQAVQVMKLMLDEDDLLTLFNENILKQKSIGTYDGAYKVIDHLTQH